jgi:hypothetical protein
MSKELDEAERRAIEMVEFFQAECRKQCEPYLKIIADIRALRPRVYVVDGKTMVPFLPVGASSPQPSDEPR